MKQVLGFIVAAIAAVLFFFVGKVIGSAYIDFLKGTGGLVTASEIIAAQYIIPAVVALFAAYLAYNLQTHE